MFKKILIVAVVLALLVAGAYALVPNSKYHLKQFVKENELLYGLTRSLVQIKYDLAAKIKGQRSGKRKAAEPRADNVKTDWQLTFDASHKLGAIRPFWGSIGFESFKGGLLSGTGRQLIELMTETNRKGSQGFAQQTFRYIRGHNLFSNGEPPWGEGCDIYRIDERGEASYDWTLMDQVFDTILDNGFKPIVEFGFMPDALASIPDRRQKWGRGNISPPADYQKWGNLVFETVKHLVDRYGPEEVRSWYFEVWNEPDLGYLFWIEDKDPARKPYGDMDEYHKLYDFTVAAAKTVDPQIRIGGPASAGGGIDMLLEHIVLEDKHVRSSVPIDADFVSTHAYGRLRSDWTNRQSKGVLRSIKWKLDRPLSHDHNEVREKMQRTPFLLTEVGPRGEGHALNNTRFAAAWFVKLIDGIYAVAAQEGDIYMPEEIVYWGSNQAIRQFEIRKGIAATLKYDNSSIVLKRPIYNAFAALGYFRGERLQLISGAEFGDAVRGLASLDGNRTVILLYHLNEQDRENAHDDSVNVDVVLQNLPFTEYRVEWYAVDQTHSNAYTVWQKLGEPRRLSDREYRQLDASDELQYYAEPWIERAEDGAFRKSVKMQGNSFMLFLLTKVD